MRATRTDGALLSYDDAGKLNFRSSVRVTGTGDLTAQALAERGSGIISFKVSRDGGMKVRWNGLSPVKVGKAWYHG